MKAICGEDAPSYCVVKHWPRQFRCGRRSVETAPIPGRPQSAIDEDIIYQVVTAFLAQEVKISVGLLTPLKKQNEFIVPRLLVMSQENQEDFFDRLSVQDET
ncbi:uncharacterized protein LOC119578489 [Penaeus monodon]|uniref:uncharacterized protein LOC119578489 n=1 Tax=Penaeus monodon TaxID=6687 RepID=UPI0018A7643F|nr:uncharacterized protein LOC119578489 [Penaeus monodon]